MPATWFIGDLHMGHEKVAALRGFNTTDEHDTAIRRQWDRQVKPGPTSGSWTRRELCVSWDAWRRLVNLGDVQKWINS